MSERGDDEDVPDMGWKQISVPMPTMPTVPENEQLQKNKEIVKSENEIPVGQVNVEKNT